MTWNTAVPAGSDPAQQGDDVIRELKSDLQSALRGNAAEGTEARFPGSDLANPVYRYRGLRGSSGARPAPSEYGLYTDTTRSVLQRDNGASWDDIATLIPAGTVMVFYQATVPNGWTKITTQNDRALRVVSGTGGVAGGSLSVSGGLTHSHTVSAHAHDSGTLTHYHRLPIYTTTEGGGSALFLPIASQSPYGFEGHTFSPTSTHGIGVTGAFTSAQIYKSSTPEGVGGATGASSPTTDSQSPVLAYIDVILGSKD